MKDHERSHIDENPFSCEVCQKSFGENSALKRHEMTHTGKKLNQKEKHSVTSKIYPKRVKTPKPAVESEVVEATSEPISELVLSFDQL